LGGLDLWEGRVRKRAAIAARAVTTGHPARPCGPRTGRARPAGGGRDRVAPAGRARPVPLTDGDI